MNEHVCPICGGILFLDVSFSVPLEYIADTPFDVARADVHAITSAWEVHCEGGHLVARNDGANDYAEPFRFSALAWRPPEADDAT